MSVSKVAVCCHSAKGHTAAIAQEVIHGINQVEAATGELIDVGDSVVPWKSLSDSDAIIFGCPTHFGSVSATMKSFIDQTDAFWLEMHWRGKFAAGFTCAGEPSGDKQSVLMTLCIFAMQHGMIWIGLDPMKDVRTGFGKPEGYNSHGAYLGAMADSNSTAVTSQSPPLSHRQTAHALGKRVAMAATRWKLGEAKAMDI